jgi:hypothetical protein
MNYPAKVNEKEEFRRLKAKKVEKWGDDYFICPHCQKRSYGVIDVYTTAYLWYFNVKTGEIWDADDIEMNSEADGFYCSECLSKVNLPDEIKNLF